MRFKKEFQWLRNKPLVLLFVDGTDVDDEGLYKGAWNPFSGGGFGGTGIAVTTFRETACMGWVIEKYLENTEEQPEMVGFSHTPGALRKWLLRDVFEE